MNFYYPTSGGSSLKWFYQTSSLIYQYGGSVYSEDGLSVAIDSKESKEALTTLAEFYTKYAFPQSVASFYNSFRYNKLPFGVTDFSTYLTLKNAAPELVGQWSITLLPGTKRDINKDGVIEDDEIDRSYIAAGTSGVIFKNKSSDEKLKQCWEFYKWWLSSSVQTEFQLTLQSTYGPEYVWLSSNINAVKNSSIDVEDKEIILQMVDWMIDINRTPGQYMVERTLSNIWNKMAISGVSPALAIESSLLSMNREVKKKMVEFGYIDNDYNILKPYYVRDKAWIENKYEGGNA